MSLFIIGSANRVTANIVLQLARNAQYSSVTIADLLPTYQHHHRFYRLRRDLDNLQLNTSLTLTKLSAVNDIFQHRDHSDVLFVTHDYYQHVTSKTKLMELTAEACRKRDRVYFATPVEYDHFGFENPETNYLKAHNKVREIAPQATIIRSDVQDKTETMAYINSSKGFIDSRVFEFSANKNFSAKVVSSQYYANVVCNALRDKVVGKNLFVQGEKAKSSYEVGWARDVEKEEYSHAVQNIAQLTAKYNGILGEGCERVAEVQH